MTYKRRLYKLHPEQIPLVERALAEPDGKLRLTHGDWRNARALQRTRAMAVKNLFESLPAEGNIFVFRLTETGVAAYRQMKGE